MTTKASKSRGSILVVLLLVGFTWSASVTTADDDLAQVVADELATPYACVSGDYQIEAPGIQDNCVGGNGGCDDLALAYEKPIEELLLIQEYSGAACGGSASCEGNSWFGTRLWEVSGEFEGSGTIHLYVQCGDEKPDLAPENIICEAVGGERCHDGPEEGEGEFGCFYKIIKRPVTDVVGECVDPANPAVVFQALDVANHTMYDVFENAFVRPQS